jgi:hypothetical protein
VLACVELKVFFHITLPFAIDNAAPESRRGSSVHEEGVKKEPLATDPGSWDERIGDP